MANLHLIQYPIPLKDFQKQAQRYAMDDDDFLFLGDSVFQLTNEWLNVLSYKKQHFYAINVDIEVRKWHHQCPKIVNIIHFDDFATLTLQATKVLAW
jgi:sulfur relay protein TusB/DsrH